MDSDNILVGIGSAVSGNYYYWLAVLSAVLFILNTI